MTQPNCGTHLFHAKVLPALFVLRVMIRLHITSTVHPLKQSFTLTLAYTPLVASQLAFFQRYFLVHCCFWWHRFVKFCDAFKKAECKLLLVAIWACFSSSVALITSAGNTSLTSLWNLYSLLWSGIQYVSASRKCMDSSWILLRWYIVSIAPNTPPRCDAIKLF
jgi:hypothetical protein